MLEDKEVLGADIFVIVLLFGNDFGLNSYFLNFFFLSSPKIGHNPPCFLCSHDLCLFLFLCFPFHMIIWPREVDIVL